MLILLAGVCSSNAFAIGADQISIVGLGAKSCGDYSVAMAAAHGDPLSGIRWKGRRYPSMAWAYTEWVLGYVSAVNVMGKPGPGQITTDSRGIALWVDNYCKSHPAAEIVSAAYAFVLSQHKPR